MESSSSLRVTPEEEIHSKRKSETPVVVTDPEQLAKYGVCRVKLPTTVDWARWAAQLSTVTLDNMGFEGDGEYAFYRNIMDEPDFPFEVLLHDDTSDIAKALVRHFGIQSVDEIRLDDAFCVHYNMEQDDTSGAKHMDPSDITVNMCLETSSDARGSQVLFHGTQALHNVATGRNSPLLESSNKQEAAIDFRFLVNQEPGFATLHWGGHSHETMRLENGKRTNIVMTFWYKDKSRSQAASRTCYLE